MPFFPLALLLLLPSSNVPFPFRTRSPPPVLKNADVPPRAMERSVRSCSTSRIAARSLPALIVRPGTVSPVPVYFSVPGPITRSSASRTNAREPSSVVPLPVVSAPVKPLPTFASVTWPPPVAAGFTLTGQFPASVLDTVCDAPPSEVICAPAVPLSNVSVPPEIE